MSPPAFRATFPGVAYQLGNVGAIYIQVYELLINHVQMVSAASAQIEASTYHLLFSCIAF